jgi:predicted metalloprotease
MRWDPNHESRDVIDRRGERGPSQAGGGIGGLLFLVPWLMRSRLGRIVLIGAVLFFGARALLSGGLNAQHVGTTSEQTSTQPETPEVHFVSFVLDDVQSAWTDEFARRGLPPYQRAKLVLFTDATRTGCGFGDAATGPFYCPADQRVYIDLGFFHALADKLGARGQFAQAYVLAHEIGHHVQNQLGITAKVDSMRAAGGTAGATGPSVRLELQADCFAGIWARSTQNRDLLEAGDIDSAIGAAAAVGDDRLQRQATGTVSPDAWTHGSSQERVRWFQRGYQSGSIEACDTFSANAL